MKGLALSQKFYEDVGKPMLEKLFPEYIGRIAAGLVGEGSECFGFDDDISQDHDFGARFCLWLPEELYGECGVRLQQAYEALGDRFCGYPVIKEMAAGGAKRSGVFSIRGFYRNLLGTDMLPEKEEDWFLLRENALAAATNGCVFADPEGGFTGIREKLLAYYPENVRRKRLTICLAYMAQTGQVNYARCLRRGEIFAAQICLGEFVRAALSALYLLNRRYMPFYKWARAGLQGASALPEGAAELEELQGLVVSAKDLNPHGAGVMAIEAFCGRIIEELHRQGLSALPDDFLLPHALEIHRHITNPAIQRMPVNIPGYGL